MLKLNPLVRSVWGLFHKAEPKTDDPGWTIHGPDIPASWGMGWWQQAFAGSRSSGKDNTAVEACVSQYSRTIAMLPIYHTRELPAGGREPVKGSNVAKIMRRPNGYQTRADFFMNLIRSELLEGNGYAVAVRDPRSFQVSQLHLLPPTGTRHYVDPIDQEIYYRVSGNELNPLDGAMLVPARDMLHVRMQTDTDPLRGITPLASGILAAKAGTAIQGHNASFFNNMSRPSGTLNTDLELNPDQTAALRTRWEQQSAGLNSGKTPILSHGLKWQPLAMSATDAEMIEFYKLTVADIARVYGIPQALVGIMDASTFSNVDALLNMWVATSLGYMVDHIELALEVLFDLPPDQHINFDLDYLLRGDFETRMSALNKGILGGVYSINEARGKEGLKPVEDGDQPRVQMQVVPLTHHDEELQLKKDRLELDRDAAECACDASEISDESTLPDDEKSIIALTAIRKAMR